MPKVNNIKTSADAVPTAPSTDATEGKIELPEDVVIDSRGRRLVLGTRDIVTESRIIRALGDSAMNTAYVAGYVNPAVMVLSIDGEECKAPKTALEIEARIQQVGRDGIVAVMRHLQAEAERLRQMAEDQQGDDPEVREVKK